VTTRPGAVDLAVVGAGIVGCAAAFELARGGASVVVFESNGIGAGASGRNSGSVQHPFDEVLAPLHRGTVERYRSLAAETMEGFDFPDAPAGLLLVALEADQLALEAERLAVEAIAPELEPRFVAASDLVRLEPMLAPDLAAVRLETAYPIPPSAAVHAYAELAIRAGVRFELDAPVSLEQRGSSDGRAGRAVVGVRRSDGTVQPAGAVLVTAGPWTAAIVDPGGEWQPIVRTWGVTVTVRLERPPGHVLEQAGVASINRPGVPFERDDGGDGGGNQRVGTEPDGHFASTFSLATARGISVVGSTFLPEEPDAGSLGPLLLHRGDRFVPSLHGLGIEELRVCARPQSLDGRPLVGRVPGHENLYIAAGHGPWGISTGPETAGLVADLILGRPVAIPAALDPARFGP